MEKIEDRQAGFTEFEIFWPVETFIARPAMVPPLSATKPSVEVSEEVGKFDANKERGMSRFPMLYSVCHVL